eukprot:753656-Hanusia_phi.AAC.6
MPSAVAVQATWNHEIVPRTEHTSVPSKNNCSFWGIQFVPFKELVDQNSDNLPRLYPDRTVGENGERR